MRITSLRIRPVAGVLAIGYGVLSPFMVIFAFLSKEEYVRIPLGVVAPLFSLNLNFDIQRPTHFFSGVLLMLLAVPCYVATGWLTGAAAVLVFNFIARRTGGIQASVLVKESTTEAASGQLA